MHNQLLRAVAFLPFIFVLFTGSFSQSTPPAKATAKADISDQPAIIEELSTSIRYENDGTNVQTVRQKIKIQSEAGLRTYGIITFNFIAGNEFSIDTVEVHKKDGSTVKAGPANIQEVTPEVSREAPTYSDVRQKQVTVPGLSVGDELLFQYTAREKALVPGQFWFEHSFTKDAVVLSESVTVDVPKDRRLHLKFQPEYKPESKNNGDRTIYQWQTSNEEVAKTQKTAHQRELVEGTAPLPSIELSTFENWDQLGAWYYGLQHERSVPTAAIKAKAMELTKGLDTDEAKARALYKYVALNFRYISLDFGIGRYQPHAADEVLANKYGDCKDKHTLLAALLEAVGLQAYPALINFRSLVDQDVPSPGQFDHLITAVRLQKNIVFLDATAEIAPYGMLVSELRHKKALVITGPQSQEFMETPADLPFAAQEIFDLKGKIDESGTMEAEVDYFIHSDSEILLKNIFRQTPPAKHKDLVQGMSYFSGFAGEVSQVKITGLEDVDGGLRITYHYHRPDYLDFHDQVPQKPLPLSLSRFPKWETNEDSVRLYLSTGELIYKCRVELPEGVTVQAPLNVKLDRDYLHYSTFYSSDKNVITGEKKIVILKPEVSGAHRSDYQAFQASLAADEAQNMVVHLPEGFIAKSTATSSTDLDELVQRAQIELRERNYNDAYADFHKVAERDPKRKGIWNQIGSVEAYMGRLDQAIGDYQKAIAADPFDAAAHTGLGGLYFTKRKQELAIAELKKAVEIDPLNHRAHYLLGWHYSIVAHDSALAVPELEKALATEDGQSFDEQQIRQMLSDEYFKLKLFDKGVESLKRLVKAAPNPTVWNNAAFALAENDQDLDLAQQYANSALKQLYEQLERIEPSSIRLPDFSIMAQLALTWDTMGWIHFRNGHLDLAEKYVRAAWNLAQDKEMAEHLGEIYEKMKRPADAMHYYALSVSEFSPSPSSSKARARLVKLVGAQRAERMIQERINEPSQSRTIHMGNIAPAGVKGQFYFVFAPGPKIAAVQLVDGDESLTPKLRKFDDKIAASVFFPEGSPKQLLREAFVMCSAYSKSCDLVFNTSEFPRNAAFRGMAP
ncbi:MAG TPA: DUF3857 domain-containing protein [Candidatus Angelobacter sp.]|nr:DUF3857 domain-containing protein [Candidatus Angelobacter sp.]